MNLLLSLIFFFAALSLQTTKPALLGPSFLDLSQIASANCTIECDEWDPNPFNCVPNVVKDYNCNECDTVGCTYGRCKVPGTKTRSCVVKGTQSTTCTNQMIAASSASCVVDVGCNPTCGIQTMVVPAFGDFEGFSCTYDSCLFDSCPPEEPTPICDLTQWSTWGGCMIPQTNTPVNCYYQKGYTPGVQTRTRQIQYKDQCVAPADNPISQSRDCYMDRDLCRRDCNQSAWIVVQPCPSCWNRYNSSSPPVSWSQSIIYYSPTAPYWGTACQTGVKGAGNAQLRSTPCTTIPSCPRDCVASNWTDWSICDKTCVNYELQCESCIGVQSRSRSIITPAEFGGIDCGPLTQTRTCNDDIPCPIPCLMSEWSSWTQCNARCGGGQKHRTRYAIRAAQYGGAACPPAIEFLVCGTPPCPVGCNVSEWGNWDITCPTCVAEGAFPGSRRRIRTINSGPQYNGSECPCLVDEDACSIKYCPQNCTTTDWEGWSACSASCGGGKQYRRRAYLQPARYGGSDAACKTFYEERTCGTDDCNRDCIYLWNPWHDENNETSECSVPCGGGYQVRNITILQTPIGKGRACPNDEKRPCNTKCCPVHCNVSEWDISLDKCLDKNPNISQCSEKCGLGWCHRTRTITTYPSCGGAGCPLLDQWISCKLANCTQPCRYSDWSGWSACSVCVPEGSVSNATSYTRTRTRTVLNSPDTLIAGTCGATSQTETCHLRYCPEDCEVDEWHNWACSTTCGYGIQHRTRGIKKSPKYGGTACPHLDEYVPCNIKNCEPTCVISDWDAWGPCPVTCSPTNLTYYKTRNRHILRNGTDCSTYNLQESLPCGKKNCPQPCILGEWGAWSNCTGCGLQEKHRTRPIITPERDGGRQCESTFESGLCQLEPCEIPCTFSPWSDWAPCSASCGVGLTSRTRYLLNYDSKPELCPTRNQTKTCSVKSCCPVNCQFSYTPWSECSFEGVRRRNITIHVRDFCQGSPCPSCQVERDDCEPPERKDVCWLEKC